MLGEIISIGDELLIGQVVNTNASFIAEQLTAAGIKVSRITTTSDHEAEIRAALDDASRTAGIVVITGGLGPTRDDITKQVLCDYFQTTLVYNEAVFANIKRIFGGRGLKWNKLNRDQALVPKASTPLHNANGTAPGMWFEKEGRIYIALPGVPLEMKSLMTEEVVPRIQERFPELSPIIHHTVYTVGIPESALATKIESWESNLPPNIKLAYLPRAGMVRLRLTGSGNTREILQEQIANEFNKLRELLPGEVFGENKDNLELIVGRLLSARGKRLSTAESCTGGYIAHLITSVAGSSAYFEGSVISYSNAVKTNQLGIDESLLIRHGAVSEEVVRAMAEGVRKKLATDYSIAVTGIAGPDGGTEQKPVGTVWIAIGTPHGIRSRKFLFSTHRQRNIERTALTALNMLRKELNS